MFLQTVKKTGPDDIIKAVQTYNDFGESIFVFLRHFKDENSHVYEIALNRDLTENEAEKIVIVWEQIFDESNGDFIIEASTPYTGEKNDDHLEPPKTRPSDSTSEENFRLEHNSWMNRKFSEGWRYGIYYNLNEMVHPLLVPWEQLPEKYKKNPKHIRSLLDHLTEARIPRYHKRNFTGGYYTGWINSEAEILDPNEYHANIVKNWAEEHDNELYAKIEDTSEEHQIARILFDKGWIHLNHIDDTLYVQLNDNVNRKSLFRLRRIVSSDDINTVYYLNVSNNSSTDKEYNKKDFLKLVNYKIQKR